MRIIVIITTVIYVVFYFIDRRTVVDEREKLIELKAANLQQQAALYGLMVIVAIYLYHPSLNAMYPIIVFALTSIYTYMFGVFYYRRKM
jgi:UDP-N-acetylmuramyl pentapeptide phosphotransferase/UDP-N-acetylglucosamine-1-phosphate transferase